MGIPQELPLDNGFYVSEVAPVAQMICTNLFPNIPQTAGAISPAQLFPTPGLVEVDDTGINEFNRGGHLFNDEAYFVNNQALYRLNSDESVDSLGFIDGSGRVSIADNGTQMCIVVPGTGTAYIFTKNPDTLTHITDPDFTGTFPDGSQKLAEIVVFIDGYFLFTTASKNFFISELNDGLSYNALDFGTAEADPDAIRSAHVYKNQVYIFGSETIEVFENLGGADFPFQRITGFVIPKGISAKFSVIAFDGTFCFIGQGVNDSPKIYIFTGGGVEPLSTTAVDLLIQEGEEQISNAFAFTYTFRGATFVGWSNVNGTIVYDSKASRLAGKAIWHRRESRGLQLKNRWRVNSLVSAYGKLYVGDSEGGIIGRIENEETTEYGNFISREFSLMTLENNSQPMFFNSIEVVSDSGDVADPDELDPVINIEPGDPIPTIAMSYTDNGRSFTPERQRSLGLVGQYNIKQKWQQLGTTRRYRIFKFRMNVRRAILKVLVDIDG